MLTMAQPKTKSRGIIYHPVAHHSWIVNRFRTTQDGLRSESKPIVIQLCGQSPQQIPIVAIRHPARIAVGARGIRMQQEREAVVDRT